MCPVRTKYPFRQDSLVQAYGRYLLRYDDATVDDTNMTCPYWGIMRILWDILVSISNKGGRWEHGEEKKDAIYQEYFHTYSIYIDMLCANIKQLMIERIIRKHRGVNKWRSRSLWESCMWRDTERCQCYSGIIQKTAIVFKLITFTNSCKKEIDTLSLYWKLSKRCVTYTKSNQL